MVNKLGQLDGGIIAFVVIVVALLFIAPILIKVVKVPLNQFSDSLTSIDQTNQTSAVVNDITNSFLSWFDILILLMFGFLLIVLLLSAFMVDIHPAYMIIYIIAMIFLFILAPNVLGSLTTIYNSNQFNDIANENNNIISHLPVTAFIVDNFFLILLGIVIITGIVMFGKFRFGGGVQRY